ncbi:MAG TPA: AMP-binding protein [Candidatus Janibacter merdipullorum]|nr:AMP-binding protein [Candidatus Janibacter merdipullorum]
MPSPEPVHVLSAGDPVAAFADAERRGRSIALPTSGTSGRPRTIVRSTDSWTRSFPALSELTGTTEDSRVWVPGPMTATMNLCAAVHSRWAGARLVDDLADATHTHLTPTALRHLLASGADLTGRHVVVAGDRIDAATRDRVHAAGGRLSHYYGAAELSFVAWGEHADALRPFPGVEVQARDGELWVRSPFVSEGYLEPDLELRTDDGWATVGDRGEVADGLVHVHGREGGITTAGATVNVADIERVLRPLAAGDLVVVGLPHPDLGEIVAAAVTDAGDVHRLPALAREVLTAAQRPRRWVHLDALPLTGNDKVARPAVRRALTRETR